LMPEAVLVAAREQPGPRRAAIRPADVTAREAHPRLRQGVEVRCRHVLAAVEADVGVALVVGDDDDDIGPPSIAGAGNPGVERQERANHQQRTNDHRGPPYAPTIARHGHRRMVPSCVERANSEASGEKQTPVSHWRGPCSPPRDLPALGSRNSTLPVDSTTTTAEPSGASVRRGALGGRPRSRRMVRQPSFAPIQTWTSGIVWPRL